MKKFSWVFVLAATLIALSNFSAAQDQFKPLNVAELRAGAKKFHRMARNLRARFNLRSQKVSALDQQVQQVIANQKNLEMQRIAQAQQQQAQAQSNAATLNAGASFLGQFVPGGNSLFGKAIQGGMNAAGQAQVNAAKQNAINGAIQTSGDQEQSQIQATTLSVEAEHEKQKLEKLARRADQFDRLADAEDLLADAEELRVKTDKAANNAKVTLELKKYSGVLESMDVW